MDLEASIAALTTALLADERVSTAILFGSAARGAARASSDLDVGLIARSDEDAAKLEAAELDLTGRLSSTAGRDVQLVVLERVEPVLGRQAFLNGRKLFERDPARSARVLERILIDYFDGEYHRRLRSEALDRRRDARRG
jgi:predicted nucleotidyltransferase